MTTPSSASLDLDCRLTALFSQESERLSGTVRHLLGPRSSFDDAHEALQNAFLRCWQRREELGDVIDLRAYVYTGVLNAARDLLRRRQVRREVELPAADDALAAPFLPPGSKLERQETVARARRAIARLAELDREVFLLRQNGELTYLQIAKATGMAVGTVKTRMRRALATLRAALREDIAGVEPHRGEQP